MNEKDKHRYGQTLTELLSQLGTQIVLLARKELALFQAEASAEIKTETAMVIYLIISAGFGILASLTLVAIAIIALQYFFPLWLSALIVFVILLLCSLVLGIIGLKKGIKSPWVRTREVIRSDIKMLKGGFA